MDDDFNSSDYEQALGDETPAVFQLSKTAGRAFRDAIHENQAADRLYSKKVLKQLENARGAPSTRYSRASAANGLDQYLADRGHDPKHCPSGELIQRYVISLIEHTPAAYRAKAVPSVSTIRSKWFWAIDALTFRYPDLREKYTVHNVRRIQAIIDSHVKLGKLYNGFYRQREWLGFVMIQKLVHAYFQHALDHGCSSWDAILNKTLAIVLQSACDCRPGDVMRSSVYKGEEYLQWKHITLTLRPGPDGGSVQHFRAKVTLKFEKGHKDVNNVDKTVFIEPLVEDAHSAVCAIKLLVTFALRWGLVYARNLDELLAHTANRVDRTVQWVQPSYPVLLAPHSTFNHPVPANPKVALATVRVMGLLAGVVKPVDNKAIRRGGARDTAYGQCMTTPGIAHQGTAAVLGHNRNALAGGVTDGYVGPLQHSNYLMKAKQNFDDALAPMISEQLAARQTTRLTKWELDEYMIAHGMDPGDTHQRPNAAVRARKDRADQWRDQAANATVAVDRVDQRRDRATKATGVADPATPPKEAAETAVAVVSTGAADAIPIDPRLLDIHVDTDQSIDVDPDSLRRLQDLVLYPSSEQSGSSGMADNDVDDQANADAAVAALRDQYRRAGHATTLPGNRFVELFSAINVYRRRQEDDLASFAGKPLLTTLAGNSREPPTLFLFECSKGCGYGKTHRGQTNQHEANCDGTSKPMPVIQCRVASCDRRFTNEGSEDCHFRRDHAWSPKPCLKCPLDMETLYPTATSLSSHVWTVHDLLATEQTCPLLAECHSTTMFMRRSALHQHLRAIHRKNAAEVMAILPSIRKGRAPPSSCPFDACAASPPHQTPAFLRFHLQTVHHMPDAEIVAMVPFTPREVRMYKKARRDPDQELELTTPHPCQLDGCDSTTLWPTSGSYVKHLRAEYHHMSEEEACALAGERFRIIIAPHARSWETVQCPQDDCRTPQHHFKSAAALHTHLTSGCHGMTEDEGAALLLEHYGWVLSRRKRKATEPAGPVQSHPCPLECSTTEVFTTPSSLAYHLQLQKTHGLSTEEARSTSEGVFGIPIKKRSRALPPVRLRCPVPDCDSTDLCRSQLITHLARKHVHNMPRERAEELATTLFAERTREMMEDKAAA